MIIQYACKSADNLNCLCDLLQLIFMRYLHRVFQFFKQYWVEISLLVSIIGIHIYLSFSGAHYFPTRWFTRDDAYYYFKVAQNISEGYGSTFDRINLTNGYHPLWMLINIPIFSLARYDLILPFRILMIVIGFLSAVTSVMLYRLLRKVFHPAIGALISMLWGFGQNVHEIIYQQGMETGITAFAIVGFLMAAKNLSTKAKLSWKEGIWFGFWGLTLLMSRLDTLFLVLFGLVWLVFRGTRIQTRLMVEILIVYISVIFAYIFRVDLSMFLLAYDTDAIIFAALLVVTHFVFNNLFGCYSDVRIPLIQELTRALLSVLISTIFTGVLMIFLSKFGVVNFSLSVAMINALLMAVGVVGFRVLLYKKNQPLSAPASIITNFNGLVINLRKWVMDGVKAGWLISTGFVIYAIFNQLTFGSPMPVSGQIKRWWGSSPDNVYGGSTKTIGQMFGVDPVHIKDGWTFINSTLYEWARLISKWSISNRAVLKDLFNVKSFERVDVYWVLFGLFLFLLLILFLIDRRQNERLIRNSGLLLLISGSVFHILFYGATSYASKHEWYWVSEDLGAFILLGWIIQTIFNRIRHFQYSNSIIWVITIITGLNSFLTYQSELITRMPMEDLPSSTPYIDMAMIMEEHTPPGSLIGMTGGGNVGYFINDRTIMNMDGLINSVEYFEALKNHDAREFYKNIGLDYIFANRYILTETAPYSYQINREELQQVEAAPTYGNKKLLFYDPR